MTEEGIKTPNANTIELHLNKPYQTLLNRLTTPEFILIPKTSIKMGKSIDLSISSGEYYVESITLEPNQCVLRSNHFHYNYNSEQAEKVIILPLAKTNGEAFENLRSNKWQFYIASVLPTEPSYEKFTKYRDNKEINSHPVSPSSVALFILLNSKRLKTDDERKSIAKLIGEKAEAEFSSSAVQVTHQLYPHGFLGAVTPSREKELFNSLKNNKKLSNNLIPKKLIGYTTSSGKVAGVADWAEKKFRAEGIQVEIHEILAADYITHHLKLDHDFLVATTGLNSKDPAGSLLYLLGSNDGIIPDPDGSLNKILVEATQSNLEKRRDLLQSISEKLITSGRIAPFLHYGTTIVSPKQIDARPPSDYDDELRLSEIRWKK
jgi:MarR-like DNA-binding transcriptional regulator SgrR of sgrS sRNA